MTADRLRHPFSLDGRRALALAAAAVALLALSGMRAGLADAATFSDGVTARLDVTCKTIWVASNNTESNELRIRGQALGAGVYFRTQGYMWSGTQWNLSGTTSAWVTIDQKTVYNYQPTTWTSQVAVYSTATHVNDGQVPIKFMVQFAKVVKGVWQYTNWEDGVHATYFNGGLTSTPSSYCKL